MNKETYERVSKVVNALDTLSLVDSTFTYESVIKENAFDSDMDTTHGEYHFIKCPFHDDDDPSLSISEERRTWYCYGCLARGDFLDFLVRIDLKNGKKTNKVQKANEILKNNQSVKNIVGFASVFVEEKNFKPIESLTFNRRSRNVEIPITLNYVLMELKALPKAQQLNYIALLQQGTPPEVVHKALEVRNA